MQHSWSPTSSDTLIAEITQLLAKHTGISFASGQTNRLLYCVNAACRDTDHDYASYLAQLNVSDLAQPVWQRLLFHLNIGETYFFRETETLSRQILPSLIDKKRSTGSLNLNIWSAGCATGEEPYTVLFILYDLLPDIAKWTITILGTDINLAALERAKQARYGHWSMRGQIPVTAYSFLQKRGNAWQVTEEIRRQVKFKLHNLISTVPPVTKADLVLCRNVLMYIDRQCRSSVLQMLHAALGRTGELVLSHGDILNTQPQPSVERLDSLSSSSGSAETPDPLSHALDRARDAANDARWAEAHQWLDRAEKLNKIDLKVHFLRALLYQNESRTDQAIVALRNCLYLDPNFALGHFLMGNMFAALGQPAMAGQHWQNARELLKDAQPDSAIELSDGLTAQGALTLIDMFLNQDGL